MVAVEEVYAHCPKSFLRGSAWKPENWLAKDAQPTSAEITLSHLRDDSLTIEMIEQTEREALLHRYE